MPRLIRIRTVIFCLALLFVSFPASAEEKKPDAGTRPVLTLDDCIRKAVEVSPEIGEARYDIDVYKAKQLQASSYRYPQLDVTAVVGPSPDADKEDLFRTDVKSTNINGAFGNVEATLIQPIYTFGRISSYEDAAASGIKVAEAGTARKTSEIVLRTKEIYYGLLLARDLRNLVLEVKDALDSSLEKAEKHIKNKTEWADPLQTYKLRTYIGEADRNLNEVDKNISLAKDALATSMGMVRGSDFEIADKTLTAESSKPGDIGLYQKTAVEQRPEFIQLSEGLKAKNSLLEAEKSGYYPQLFVALRGSFSGSTNRDKIDNPYISDYFNHAYIIPLAGLKWSLDFGITKAKVREAEAEYRKIAEKKRFADEAIPFQVRKSYLDFEESRKSIVETEVAYKNAKKWLVSEVANFDLGVADAKDVGDAAAAYALVKSNYLKSLYNNRLAYANLLYAAGLDRKELK